MPKTAQEIAAVAYEVNRALCGAYEQELPDAWADLSEEAQISYAHAAQFHLANPTATAEETHDAWCLSKFEQGWQPGTAKDAEAFTNPNLVPFSETPQDKRVKEAVFKAIVNVLSEAA